MLAANATDLLLLPGAQSLIRIETPQPLHQTLAPKHFVAAGDAAMKIVGNVEKGAVAVCDASVKCQEIRWYAIFVSSRLAPLELFYRARGPDRPVSEQATPEIDAHRDTVLSDIERQREVEQNVVVIAGVERDAIQGAARRYAAQDVEGAIAVEWCDLNTDNVLDRGETAPEIGAKHNAPTAGWR